MVSAGGGATLGRAVLELTTDDAALQSGLANARRGTDQFLNSTGRQAAATGATLSAALTAPLVGFGTASLTASIDFESAFAGVRKTVDATEEQFAELRTGILDMSEVLPASATDIARVAEAAGQLGVETDSILDFTRVMIDLGETTNLSATDAATALARLANITQLPQNQVDRLGATIVALGNNLATTEAEIVSFGLRIAAAGKQIGLSEDQILSWAGALSSVGIDAEAGGTAISRVFIDIAQAVANGGDKLEQFAAVAGVSSEEFARAFRDDASAATVTFIEGLGRLSDEGENVFGVLDDLSLGNIRVRDTLLRTAGAGDLLRDSLEIGSEAWEDNTALTKEAEQRYDTLASKLAIARNEATRAAIAWGDVLAPAVGRFTEMLGPVVDLVEDAAAAFGNLDPKMQSMILVVVGLLAVAGPLLLVFGGLAIAIAAISAPVLLVVGVLALLAVGIAAVVIWWDDILARFPFIEAGLNAVGDAVARLTGWWQDSLVPALEEAKAKFDRDVMPALETVAEFLEFVLRPAVVAFTTYWKLAFDNAVTIVQAFAPAVAAVFNLISEVIEFQVTLIRDIIAIALALLRGDWEGAWEGIKTLTSNVLEGIVEIVTAQIAVVVAVVQAAWETILGIIQNIKDAIDSIPTPSLPGLPSLPGISIPGFQSGGVVPGPLGMPQLAVVHGGEEVLTPDQRAAMFASGGSRTVVFEAHFHGPVADRRGAADMVRGAISDLRRQGVSI